MSFGKSFWNRNLKSSTITIFKKKFHLLRNPFLMKTSTQLNTNSFNLHHINND